MPQSAKLEEDGFHSDTGGSRLIKESQRPPLPPDFSVSREELIEFKMKKMWSVTLGRHGPTKEEENQRRQRLRELQQPHNNMETGNGSNQAQPVTNTLKAIKRKKEKMKRAKTFREEQQQQQMMQQQPHLMGSGFLNNNYIYPPPLHHGQFFPEMTGMRPSKSLGNIIRSSSAGRPPRVFPSGMSPGFSAGSGSNSSRSGSRDALSRRRYTVALEDEEDMERERTGILGFRKSRSKPDLSTNKNYFGSRPQVNMYNGYISSHMPNGPEQKLRFLDEVEGVFPGSGTEDPGQMTREISKSMGNMDRVGQRLEAVRRLGAQTPTGRKSVADFSRFSRVQESRGSGRRMANPRRLRRRFRGVTNSEEEDEDDGLGDGGEGFDANNNAVSDFSVRDFTLDEDDVDVDFDHDGGDFNRPKR